MGVSYPQAATNVSNPNRRTSPTCFQKAKGHHPFVELAKQNYRFLEHFSWNNDGRNKRTGCTEVPAFGLRPLIGDKPNEMSDQQYR